MNRNHSSCNLAQPDLAPPTARQVQPKPTAFGNAIVALWFSGRSDRQSRNRIVATTTTYPFRRNAEVGKVRAKVVYPASVRFIPVGADTHVDNQRHLKLGRGNHALVDACADLFYDGFFDLQHQLVVDLHDHSRILSKVGQ